MKVLVLAIGLLNLGLGYLLGKLMDHPGPGRWPSLHRPALRIPLPRGLRRLASILSLRCLTRRRRSIGDGLPMRVEGPRPWHAIGPPPECETQVLDVQGFQALVEGWATRDADRVRMVAGILLQVDQTEGDHPWSSAGEGANRLREAFADFLHGLIRRDRGFDRLARMDEHRFVLFLGDTAVRNAVMVAERIRQTIAASQFVLAEQTVPITASCAVAEWRSDETAGQWTGRMQQLLRELIATGGNQCRVEDERGPRTVPVSPYSVPKREVCVAL